MSFKITAGFFTLNKCKQLFTSVNVNTLGQSFSVYLKSAVQFCIFLAFESKRFINRLH